MLFHSGDGGSNEVGEPIDEPIGNTGKVFLCQGLMIILIQAEQLTAVGVSCVFDVLRQLSKRDPDLCVHALSSLLGLLQNMPTDSLRNESKSSIESMMNVLRQLREEGRFF